MYGLVLLYHIGLMTYQKLWPSVSSNYGNLRPQKGFHVTQECCGLISCDSVMLWPYATTNSGRFWLDLDYIRPPYGLRRIRHSLSSSYQDRILSIFKMVFS